MARVLAPMNRAGSVRSRLSVRGACRTRAGTSWRDESTRRGFGQRRHTEKEIFTVDGAMWILEVCEGDRRRVVVRKSPQEKGPFRAYRELCLTFLRWAEIRLRPDQVY